MRNFPAYAAAAFAFIMLSQAGRSDSTSSYHDVAFSREPGVQVEYSSFTFRSKKPEEQMPCPVNCGPDAADALGPCHWKSNEFQHLPQWVWVHFGGPKRIDKVVLHAAAMDSRPIEFAIQYSSRGSATFNTIVNVEHADFDARTLISTLNFAPVITDNLRLLINRTAATEPPQSWFGELAQLEVYGIDASAGMPTATTLQTAAVNMPHAELAPTQFVPNVDDLGETLAIATPWYRIVLDKSSPRIVSLALDSLGKSELGVNLLDAGGARPTLDEPFENAAPLAKSALRHEGNLFTYAPAQIAPGAYEEVSIRAGEKGFDLELATTADRAVRMRGGVFRFQFAANQTPTTFVCRPSKLMNYVDVPA